jgi:hypothetical protein
MAQGGGSGGKGGGGVVPTPTTESRGLFGGPFAAQIAAPIPAPITTQIATPIPAPIATPVMPPIPAPIATPIPAPRPPSLYHEIMPPIPAPITAPITAQPGQYAPMTPQGDFNVNQAAAGSLQQGIGATQQALGFAPQQIQAQTYDPTAQSVSGQQTAFGYNPTTQDVSAQQTTFGYDPAQAQAQQLATTDLGQYQSPYQQQVIDATMRDIGTAQEKSLNLQGAQASRAGAFGGSRQGIAESETRAQYGQQAADAAARLRQSGFQQAQQAAKFDVGQRAATEAANVAARTGAAQYGAGSAASAQLGNINRAQQVQAQNAAAQMAAAQYGAGAQTSAQLGNINREQQVQAQNAAAQMAAQQFAAQQRASAQSQNLGAQQGAAQFRLGAGQQLAGMGQQAFGTGQAIQQQQAQQGLMQQGLQQALIDAARGQYANYTGAPTAALSAPLAALGVTPNQSTTTNETQPGLFNYLQLAAGLG